ncbi:hypothetical protein JDV02_008779 [Purpureocillium takamizusanense]|uniref:Pyridoxamine kinase/Phosphomethylpyrimidine kinase domain-containing protein n=1 Tax=Purpureocillium takamizusanense TaxID=2060973 RepID=A0A9Q8QNM4_9HYPO|nr:uncharacterized protein JDV02_008779 [Purpureocillium takamizusanense]UNI22935.1 hypothetical protein JDV02_008779 [Purpureocillium takamizusanense]
MEAKGVLVFGCSDTLANMGLDADKKAVMAQGVPVSLISTGSVTRNGSAPTVIETPASELDGQIAALEAGFTYSVVKIGALLSHAAFQAVSTVLLRGHLVSIIDTEPLLKTGSPESAAIHVAALREEILPSIDVLSATVPEAKILLDEASIPMPYPQSLDDVKSMANALRRLGPKNVIIKREVFDESDGMTTLHYVLCGGADPIMATLRFPNPTRFFGASYSIPPTIAAHLANGSDVAEAVSASFKFAEEMLREGRYFV